jgi:GH25 family lysozyme M1 (1,4-beta-N-acetylmuramidase)
MYFVGAFAGEFDQPWKDPNVPLILDPYYDNPIDWGQLATEPRVAAVIHRATIGTAEVDRGYFQRKAEAKKRGYLWGSYHLGLRGSPVVQADFYIDTVKPEADELIALDLEDPSLHKWMSLDEAFLFIKQVKERLGRYPVLYMNDSTATLISANSNTPDLANSPLWYASPNRSTKNFPRGVWPTYTLWQFSTEKKVQLRIPGTKTDMDIDVFNGSVEKLKADWPLTKSAPK